MAANPKFTFEMSPELREMMDAHPEINWSEVCRQAVRKQVQRDEIARRIQEEMDDPRVQAVAEFVKEKVAAAYQRDVHAGRG